MNSGPAQTISRPPGAPQWRANILLHEPRMISPVSCSGQWDRGTNNFKASMCAGNRATMPQWRANILLHEPRIISPVSRGGRP